MVTSPADNISQNGGQRYRHLFEHAPICIFVVDLNAQPVTILEVNRRAQLLYGYTATEMMGMPATQLAPEDAMSVIQAIAQQIQQGQTVTAETIGRRRDDTRLPVRMIAAIDPADEGKMIVTVEDISTQIQRRTEAEAIDAERRRIAHEIHDGVAQSLAGLRFKSALWSHLGEGAPPNMRAALDELQSVITDAIVDLRRAIFALRPLDLDAVGFFPALTQLVADFGDQNQLAARLDLSGPQDTLPVAYELPLFRIVQEGLNNTSQHARADKVLVRLTMDRVGGIILSMRDNGCGFDPRQLDPIDRDGHFGLRQMRERVVDRGGTLDIRSAPGQGTELIISLPVLTQEANHAAN